MSTRLVANARSTRIVTMRLAALAAAVAIGACAAAMPGYVPEGGRNKSMDRIKPMEGGTLANNGTYVPSQTERELDCKKLRGSMQVMISRLKDGGRTPAPSAVSAAAQSTVAAVRGKALMLEASEADRRERARLEAYNRLLVEKNCPAMDIQAELAAPGAGQAGAAPAAATKKR